MTTEHCHRFLGRGSFYTAVVAISLVLIGCRDKPAPTASDPDAGRPAPPAGDGTPVSPSTDQAASPPAADVRRTRPDVSGEASPAEASGIVVTIAPDPAQPDPTPSEAGDAPADPSAPALAPAGAPQPGVDRQAIQIELAEPPYPPQVFFSERHAATNLVGVGDAMPELQLPDLDDQPRSLRELYGQRMTIVLFWTANRIFTAEEFTRLNNEVADVFFAAGVNVVAINVGDSVEDVQPLVQQTTGRVVNLLDTVREAFATVATEHLPRVYLLDSAGKILWFDIEYSRSTRRELRNAVVYHLPQANLKPSGN